MPNVIVAYNWNVNKADTSALALARQLVADHGGAMTGLTQGDGKSMMAVLDAASRGAQEVVWVANKNAKKSDAFVAGHILSAAAKEVTGADMILCSANQEVGLAMAQALNLAHISNVVSLSVKDGKALVERKVGSLMESLSVEGPAVYSLDPSFRLDYFPHINDIVAAKETPACRIELADLGLSEAQLTPQTSPKKGKDILRKQVILQGSMEEQAQELAAILLAQGVVTPTAAGTTQVGSTAVTLLDTSNLDESQGLAKASTVVAMGMGVQEQDLPKALAEALSAQMGCTRPVAWDRKWMPDEAYIGVSGVNLAANLYVGLGISGAVQHTAGLKAVKTVVAINNDPEAPIFKAADYGIVGDYQEFLPHLLKALKKA